MILFFTNKFDERWKFRNQIRRLESNGCYSPDDGSDGAEERDALDIGIDSVEEID
jgi:hypothetical protein